MKKRLSILVIFLGLGAMAIGQNPGEQEVLSHLQDGGTEGKIRLEADSLLVVNYYKLLTASAKVKGVPGYRIRIFSESGLGAKEKQQRIRARFLTEFPEIDAYNRYDEPYFKVYVGDCRTRSEALKLYDQIKKEFPNPILVEDNISMQ